MAFSITSNVVVGRDVGGRVTSLQHLTAPYRRSNVNNAQALATAYVVDVAATYGVPQPWLASLDQTPSDVIESASTELRFAHKDAISGTASVSFQQTHFGLPIWEAGLTVSLLTDGLRVVGSESSLHSSVTVTMPSKEARYMPDNVTAQTLRALLKLDEEPRIAAKRLWIYRFNTESHKTRSASLIGLLADSAVPTLTPPPAPATIVRGRHYVVTEVLFALNLGAFRDLTWRAMIEVETGAILLLVPLIAAWTGDVFLKDPITATGDSTFSGCSTVASLDALRSDATLNDLTDATPQGLTGSYVTITDDSVPPLTPPTLTGPATDFSYSSRTDNFAAVNAYHHVDELFRLIVSFGYSPLSQFFSGTSFPVPTYYRDLSVVNAFTSPNATGTGLGKFQFGYVNNSPCGDGSPPTGIVADWRVVMHEFVHGMLFDRTHNGFLGFAHNGGDGFAAINMDPGSNAPDRFLTFPWISLLSDPTQPGSLRRHDRDVASGWAWGGSQDDGGDTAVNPAYQAEQILSTTLFRIYRSTGGDSTALAEQQLASSWVLLVMTRAMASLPLFSVSPSTAASYANALITADAAISSFNGIAGGAIGKVVRWSFEKQGLYQPPAAPTPVTTPGAPPDVDVYVNDAFYGEYGFQADYWDNTNIWNRLVIDPTTTPVDHQTPIVNQTNYAYVYVSNRGTQPANNVVVYGYHCRPSAPITWPDNFQAMTTTSIALTSPIAPGSTVLVGPFDWTPTMLGHECMLMVVSADGDLSNADPASGLPCATGPTPDSRLVPFDNNIGQRNVAPVAGGGGLTGLTSSFNPRRFWFSNPFAREVRGSLEVKLPAFLKRRGWELIFLNPGGARFIVPARSEQEIVFRLNPGQDFTAADVREAGSDNTIIIRSLVDGVPSGGMSYRIDPKLIAPPSETSATSTAGDCTNQAGALLECLDLPTGRVKSVRIKRITLEIEFKDEC